jgi:CheY-like chemotaxis protein
VKDEFVAMLSHELRTPLHAMLGWAALLQRGGLSAAKQERALDAITRNVRAQSRIVDDLLDLSDIVTGNLRLRMERVELVDVIQGALETIRPAAEAKGVALAVDVSPQAGAVSGDANRLRQVMWNLLSNAVRFTPPSGRIDVRARRAESSAILEVGDTGSGIPAEELPRVFERFWQLDSSRTRAHGGLGLGLAIVRYLVEAHGGSVSAHSEGRGRGALFVVELPSHAVTRSVDVPRQQDRPERSAPDAAPSLAGVRALVVEDDPESQDLLRTILEQAGARVTAARRAREALEASRCQAFDVVISDIGMPETNGHAFLKLLRARLPAPAIALTAFASASEADQARRAGYERHLAKPIDFGRVVDSVREVVAEYRAARLLP